MNQSTTFLLGMTGLMLLFWVMGIIPENTTLNSSLLSTLTDISNLQNSTFAKTILGFTALVTAGAVILGFFFKNYELMLRIPLGAYLIGLLWDFIVVYIKVAQAGTVIAIIALLFFAPLMVVWYLTMVDYMFGKE